MSTTLGQTLRPGFRTLDNPSAFTSERVPPGTTPTSRAWPSRHAVEEAGDVQGMAAFHTLDFRTRLPSTASR